MRPNEVLIINQGDGGLADRLKVDLPVRVVDQQVKGVARARSRALEESGGDWVLFTDDDQEVNAEWIEQLLSLVKCFPGADMFGGVVLPPPVYNKESEFVSQLYIPGEVTLDADTYLRPFDASGMLADLWGGNYALSRRCVEKVGLYDEFLGRGSKFCEAGEDTDYAMRAISSGLTGVLSCRMIVYHTFGVRPISETSAREPIEVAAALAWKSQQDPANLSPELASRLQPFGRKKAALARLTGGVLYENEGWRKSVFDEQIDKLNSRFKVQSGRLVEGAAG